MNISDNQLRKVIESIIQWIKDNKKIMEKIAVEDKEACGFELDLNQLIEVFQNYKIAKTQKNKNQKVLIHHHGNPYITAMLCIEAMINNSKIIIGTEDVCYGANQAIIKIVNEVLKEYKIPFKMKIIHDFSISNMQNIGVEKLICLGNSNAYMSFRKQKNVAVKYIPLFDISVYYDSDEYEELAQNMIHYATKNFYEIETFDETEDFDDVIYIISQSYNQYATVILSKDLEKQNRFKQEVKCQSVFINENPFKQFELKIPKEVWGDENEK